MPKTTFDATAESSQFELLPDGDYPFQIVGVGFGLSTGPKTSGSDVMECKVAFYKDDTFTKKVAQWGEDFIFHDATAWKLSVFAKSANLLVDGKPPGNGVEIDFTEEEVLGLRGWATVRSRASSKDATKKYNHVAVWLTNKPKLARAPLPKVKPETDPWEN